MGHLIGAVGDLTVDILLHGLSAVPEWGQEAEIQGSVMRLGGNVGNMAAGAGALGTDFQVIADVGTDANGEYVISEIRKLGLEDGGIRKIDSRETSKTYACIRPDGERFMMTSRGTLELIESTVMQEPIPQSKVLFLGGWCLPPRVRLDRIGKRLEKWRDEGRILATDLIWSDETWQAKECLIVFLKKMDLVFLNEKELVALTETEDQREAVAKLRQLLDLPARKAAAVVKLGAAGATLVLGEGEYRTGAYPCKPVDTVGAGDLFNLGFLHARFQLRFPAKKSLSFASVFASLFISRYGSTPPSQREVLQAMEEAEQ